MSLRIFATTAALRRAERLLPGVVLENEVERAIMAGRKRRWAPPEVGLQLARHERFVIVNSRVGVVLVREVTPLGRKCWRAVRLVELKPKGRR